MEGTQTLTVVPEVTTLHIPSYRQDDLDKKISKANSRLDKTEITDRFAATYAPYEKMVLKGAIELIDPLTGVVVERIGGTLVAQPWLEVTLQTVRISAGHYTFVASLVAEEAGYTVHTAPDQSLDGWQRPEVGDMHCDHCNTNRYRKRLYVIRDERDGSLHQIGHNCIELYTGLSLKGLWVLEWGHEIRGWADEDEGCGFGSGDYGVPVNTVLGYAFAFSDEGRGYVSRKAAEFGGVATVDKVREGLFGKVDPPSPRSRNYYAEKKAYDEYVAKCKLGWELSQNEELIGKIRAAAVTLKTGTDYADNMNVILAGERVSGKNVGILSSLVAVYARENQLRADREQTTPAADGFVAPVGQRVKNITLTLSQVKMFDGNYGTTTLLVGRTSDQHVVKWFASGNHDYNIGDTITLDATVKAHDNYKGTDQTVVTRGRIAA
jgi:hypothetical protein